MCPGYICIYVRICASVTTNMHAYTHSYTQIFKLHWSTQIRTLGLTQGHYQHDHQQLHKFYTIYVHTHANTCTLRWTAQTWTHVAWRTSTCSVTTSRSTVAPCHVCTYIYVYMYVHVCMYICMYISYSKKYVHIYMCCIQICVIFWNDIHTCIFKYIYLYTYTCIYIYIYVCIYIHVCTYHTI